MLRVLARHLQGMSSPGLDLGPGARALARPVLPWVNRLPPRVREQIYTWSGVSQAVPQRRVGEVDAEDVAAWVVGPLLPAALPRGADSGVPARR